MKEAHKILQVKLERDDRLKLYSQITGRMKEKGYDPMLGARPLRRAIQRYIEDKLSDAMLERQFPAGTVVKVDAADDDTVLTVNGELVAGNVELPMVGLNEPLTRVGSGQSSAASGPDSGTPTAV